MGVALSCDPSLARELHSVTAQFQEAPVIKTVQDRLVLRPSNAVVEASDYLTSKHDWLQMTEELTDPLHRVLYVPGVMSNPPSQL
mmetsp:Transcript_96248/g.170941  ORF Transcript_96248/g.170941 Transcript_96248/m.170941 type:complete len:85 (+) Transcript_96248:308-562(+)